MRRAADDAPALPFQSDRAGVDVAVHGPLLRRQTPYLRFIITTEAQAARRPLPTNEEPLQNEDAGAVEDHGSCARTRDGPANGGE